MEAAGPGESCVTDYAPWLQEMIAEQKRSWLLLSRQVRPRFGGFSSFKKCQLLGQHAIDAVCLVIIDADERRYLF
jgi:hypothetical protein